MVLACTCLLSAFTAEQCYTLVVKLNWHDADRSVLAWLARRYSHSMFVNFWMLEQGMLKEMHIGWGLRSPQDFDPLIQLRTSYINMSRTLRKFNLFTKDQIFLQKTFYKILIYKELALYKDVDVTESLQHISCWIFWGVFILKRRWANVL